MFYDNTMKTLSAAVEFDVVTVNEWRGGLLLLGNLTKLLQQYSHPPPIKKRGQIKRHKSALQKQINQCSLV